MKPPSDANMSVSGKLGEIFSTAGQTFMKLGNLTKQLEESQQQDEGSGAKWTNEEVDMLYHAVRQFADGLKNISEVRQQRTLSGSAMANVTLNELNAGETEVDVESLMYKN